MANIDFYFDINDFTLETINDNSNVLNQGQTNSIEFRFYFGDYTSGSFVDALSAVNMIDNPCLLNIERPNGTSSNNVATTAIPEATPKYFKLVISDWVTEFSGTLQITTKRFNPITEVEQTFGLATLQILPSAEQSNDTIEDAQYQALLSYLATTGSNRTQVVADGAIDELDLVMFSGTVGGSGKIKVRKATQSGAINIKDNPEYVYGIAIESASNNQEFYVQTLGVIEDVDTTSFEEGKVLVPSATIDGGLIEFDNVDAPQPPFNRMPIAVCVYSHQNHGILMIRPTFFPRMSQVKDVYIDYDTITQGQGLVWNNNENRFEPGFSGGVFYDDNLPKYDDRFDNLTWFDEGEPGINTWVLPTIYWQPYVVSANQLRFVRYLTDSYGAYREATKIEILNSGMQLLTQTTDPNLVDLNLIDWYNSWTNFLIPYQFYYVRFTFEYENQDGIVVQDVRIAQFQFII